MLITCHWLALYIYIYLHCGDLTINQKSGFVSILSLSLSWKLTDVPWKSLVGKCVPYWNSRPFLGDVCYSFQGVFDAHAERANANPRTSKIGTRVTILCVCEHVILLNMICIYNTYIYIIIYIIININVQQQQQQQQQHLKSEHPLWLTRFESPHGRWDKT